MAGNEDINVRSPIAEQEEDTSISSTNLSAAVAIELRNEISRINPYCQQLKYIGTILNDIIARVELPDLARDVQPQMRMPIVSASLRSAVQYFDVAHITADHTTGERLLTFHSIAGTYGSMDMNSHHVEPLIYPLLFPHGERGWGDNDSRVIPYNRYLSSRLLMPELQSCNADPMTGGPHFLTIDHESDVVEIVSLYLLLNSLIFVFTYFVTIFLITG